MLRSADRSVMCDSVEVAQGAPAFVLALILGIGNLNSLQPELKPLEVSPVDVIAMLGLRLDVCLTRKHVHLNRLAILTKRRDGLGFGEQFLIGYLDEKWRLDGWSIQR